MSELEYDNHLVAGCMESGIIGFVGDGAPPELYKVGIESLKNAEGFGGIILKPRANQDEILKRIRDTRKFNIKFIGLDIDAAAFGTMALYNQRVDTKTIDQLKKLIDYSKVPFIIKGVMSVEDAENAVQAGASAIVVSNHGGRITENHPSSISVLQEIAHKIKGRIKIIFDGGIRSGEDIFKALALGADYVMVGRPFSIAVMGGNKTGIKILVKQYKEQLKKIMLLTGSSNIEAINEDMVIIPDFNNEAYNEVIESSKYNKKPDKSDEDIDISRIYKYN